MCWLEVNQKKGKSVFGKEYEGGNREEAGCGNGAVT